MLIQRRNIIYGIADAMNGCRRTHVQKTQISWQTGADKLIFITSANQKVKASSRPD